MHDPQVVGVKGFDPNYDGTYEYFKVCVVVVVPGFATDDVTR